MPGIHALCFLLSKDQRKRCERLRDKFSKAVCRHLNNVFVHLGNDTERMEAGGGPGAFGGVILQHTKTLVTLDMFKLNIVIKG